MHIEFKRVVLHNFMSFGDATLQFNDDGFIKVTGINENPLDNAGSNGSGKSSLWEAIIWAITGETIRGTKHVANYYGEDGCFVDIEFYIDKTKYQIVRSKDHKVRKTNIQILINGEDVSGKGIRDSEKLLQQYLPDLTASLLGSVIILGQGLPQKFTNNTPSGRKEVLEKLSKSDFMIEDLKKRVSDRKIELTNDLRSCEDSIVSLEAKNSFLQNQITQQSELLSSLNESALQEKKSVIVDQQRVLSDNVSHLNTLIETLFSSKEELLKKRNSIVDEENKQLYELDIDRKFRTEHLLETKSKLTAELSVLKNQLTAIRNIKDVCPTCGQKLPNVHKPDTSEIETSINMIEANLQDVRNQITLFEQEYNTNYKLVKNAFLNKKSSIDLSYTDICKEYDSKRAQKQKEEHELSQLNSDLSKIEVQLAQLQVTIDNCNKIIRENNENIRIAEDEILYNNKQRDLAQSRLEVISKFDTALKRDFRGYLLSTVISYIQERAKQYCKVIFDTSDIDFCLNGNNIDINYMNRAYENLSGGEKQKIDLIIQFSIRDMLSAQLNFTSNVLVLDEVFDGLDMIGCNRVIDMISNLSDVKNVFIVTHRKDLSIPNDKELIVAKSSAGFSEIRV